MSPKLPVVTSREVARVAQRAGFELHVEHDDVVKALMPDRADQPFAVRILPG